MHPWDASSTFLLSGRLQKGNHLSHGYICNAIGIFSMVQEKVSSRSFDGKRLRRHVLRGAVIVFVTAGYSGKKFIFEKVCCRTASRDPYTVDGWKQQQHQALGPAVSIISDRKNFHHAVAAWLSCRVRSLQCLCPCQGVQQQHQASSSAAALKCRGTWAATLWLANHTTLLALNPKTLSSLYPIKPKFILNP